MIDELGDEDAWSYSFPPSSDSLPLGKSGIGSNKSDTSLQNSGNDKELDDTMNDLDILDPDIEPLGDGQLKEEPVGLNRSEDDLAILNAHLMKVQGLLNSSLHNDTNGKDGNESISSTEFPKDSKGDSISQVSSKSSLSPIEYKKDLFNNGSATHSLNSLTLQSPFLKSGPANPFTTKEDASSIMSNQSSKNGLMNLEFHDENLVDKLLESPKRLGNYLSYIRSSSNATLSLDGHKRNATDPEIKDIVDQDDESRNSFDSPKSPKIIQYRKSKRTASENNFQEILENSISLKEKYDDRLYVDEKYKETKYRYTTIKRNTDFHQLFRSLDLTDRLLDDFACALSREILLQGRIYVSENYICFNSSLLGWVTNLVIKMEDIIKFEKKSTAGIFPNGIVIETTECRHTFASFVSRDATIEFMIAVWEGSTGKTMVLEDENNKANDESAKNMSDDEIGSYIMTIDEDSTKVQDMNLNDMLDSDSDNVKEVKTLVFKKGTGYTNEGPAVNYATKVKVPHTLQDNETELYNEVIDAPVGVIYELLVGNKEGKFFQKVMESQGSSELDGYGELVKNDDGNLSRNYTYRKTLGYSIGPKTTTCNVTEEVTHLDFKDYIVFENITKTPDVPLGTLFFVKTITRLSWASSTTTKLQISYYIEWTGKSWIKGIIEKLTLTGQKDNCSELLKLLTTELEECCTAEFGEAVDVTKEEVDEDVVPTSKPKITSQSNTQVIEATNFSDLFGKYGSTLPWISIMLLFIIVILNQIMIMNKLSKLDIVLKKIADNYQG